MSKFLRTAALAACVGGAMAIAPASEAQTQVRAAQQAPAQQQSGARTEYCAKVEVHLSDLGMAFACYQAQPEPEFMIVVDEQGFAGRMDYVWEILSTSTQIAAGSTRGPSRGIHVSMLRATDPKSRAICSRTIGIAGTRPCFKALNIMKRS